MISSGQHTGLAAQVASGAVSNVMIWVGFNDFDDDNGEYGRIYSGVISGQVLQAKLDRVVADLTEAVDVLLLAGSPRIVLATLVDTVTPSIIESYPNPLLRQRVTDAIDEVNTRLTTMANARGIALIDLEVLRAVFIQLADENGFIEIGGELIDLSGVGNEPHNLILGDGKHSGTVGSGLLVNILILESFNQFYGLGIPPLTDQEILSAAGFAVPEPSAWVLQGTALAVIAGLARRLRGRRARCGDERLAGDCTSWLLRRRCRDWEQGAS
jgi:hypothetical protein